mmetsp:Transcript_23627/g.51569  ORF Transcript_23627/g.51569 Transcript_23627/m.51569 type:complete len:585 (-) Transcript_23627:329-2083(-)|eukprot:CAMPEP_0118926968 /NCGR_PEP_ID=MMETSP1169-20130426/4559_1 /TAXON_ID=36882 /ORGANISM="Pyramimonas obovata, Strain CCMP722" /LENGTH=584 /DNA_ID=CAMNT_0006868637 /DNA_START=197 /DNA_END=1951 /DNA_ORIENTATION=-
MKTAPTAARDEAKEGGRREGSVKHVSVKPWVTSYARKIEWSYDPTGQEIGRGSFGVIRTAVARNPDSNSVVGIWTPKVGEEVVVKSISKIKSLNFKDCVRNEVEVWKTLTSHPGFPKLYDIYENKTEVFFVMERCLGGELTQALATCGSFSEKVAAALFQQMVKAVAHMHSKNIIHRDLKPANFLIAQELCHGEDLTSLRIVCADFGLAQYIENDEKLEDSSGTLDFMAPEQLGKDPYKGKPADVWSLGCILYMLLCGKLPFGDSCDTDRGLKIKIRGAMLDFSPPDIWNQVSDNGKDLVKKLMLVDWEARLNVFDTLEHPWFKEMSDEETPQSQAQQPLLDTMVVTQMQEFNSWNMVKKKLTLQLAKQLAKERSEDVTQRLTRRKSECYGKDAVPESPMYPVGGTDAGAARAPRKSVAMLGRYNSSLSTHKAKSWEGSGLAGKMDELRAIFDAVDEHKVGTVTIPQLVMAIQKIGFRMEESELVDMVSALGAIHNHGIDYEEFLAATLRLQIAEHNDILEQIFQEVDDDDDGLISVDDLRDVLGVNTEEDEEELQGVLEEMEGSQEGGVDYVEFLQKFMESDN